jgi:hypothetical protein
VHPLRSCLLLACVAGPILGADAAAPTATTPAATPADSTAPIAPAFRPVRVAQVADLPPTVSGTIIFDTLYDSNVMLLPDTSVGTGPTREGSPTIGTEVRLDWRVWNSHDGFVKLGGIARQEQYQESPQGIDSNGRFGGNLVAAWTRNQIFIPSLVVASTRYVLDGDPVADDLFVRIAGACRHDQQADIVSLDAHRVLYDRDTLDERSGVLWAGGYRHWFLLTKDSPARRIELGVRAGTYIAHEDWQDYLTVRPDAQFHWRFGEGGDRGNLRLRVGTSLELRSYRETAPGYDTDERQRLWASDAELAYGMSDTSSVGPFASFTRRVDNLPDRDYNRWTLGLRIQIGLP